MIWRANLRVPTIHSLMKSDVPHSTNLSLGVNKLLIFLNVISVDLSDKLLLHDSKIENLDAIIMVGKPLRIYMVH